MTKEQAIKIINDLIQNGFTNFCGNEPLSAEETDAFEIAIKALEQQPIDDCVSRQAVLNAITEIDGNINMDIYTNEVREIVKELPPVTPASKQSEWYLRGGKFTCKNCEERALLKLTDATGGCREYNYYTSNFCPNCGAEMRGAENENV